MKLKFPRQIGWLIILPALLGYQLQALEIEVLSSFSTESITDSPVHSVTVDPENGDLLLGAKDGSIIEVMRNGSYVRTFHPPKLVQGGNVPPGEAGLAVAPALDRVYGAGHFGSSTKVSLLHIFERSTGRYLSFAAIHTLADYHGIAFDDSRGVPELFLITVGSNDIFKLTVGDNGDRARFETINLPMNREGNILKGISGMAYLPEWNLFLISLWDSRLFVIEKTLDLGDGFYWSGIVSESSLAPLGIQSVYDVAYDPPTKRLYVTDVKQRRVFELLLPLAPFHRGDPNADGLADVSDPVGIFEFLFLGAPAPGCLESADVNNDGRIDISDGIQLLEYLFHGGPSPAAPGPPGQPCGPEPDPRDALLGLGCRTYEKC